MQRESHLASVVISREEMSERCGCQGKLPGAELDELLAVAFCPLSSPVRKPDDCAVLKHAGGDLLATNDLGPLVGPDLLRAGRIAAVHALSDVYAMGGDPLWALVTLIIDRAMPEGSGAAVLRGIAQATAADGVEVVGGQTLVGPEGMAGLSVIGRANPTLLTKDGARPADRLMLSKPLGSGLVVRAFRLGLLDEAGLEPALRLMETSNRAASRAAVQAGAHACTDVTGFGLLGHLAEMLAPDQLGATLHLDRVPLLDALHELPAAVAQTSWIRANLDYARSRSRLHGAQSIDELRALLDPQTSGGLLVAVTPESVAQLEHVGFVNIGTVTEKPRLELSQ